MKNRIVQAALWLGVICGGGFLSLALLFYLGEPQPSHDYLAEINEPFVNAADDQKGWTIYRDLWIKHGFSEGGGFKSLASINDEEQGWRLVRPEDGEAWEAATRQLTDIDDLMEGFRVGGLRPYFGVPYYSDRTEYSEVDFKALFPGANYEEYKSEVEAKQDGSTPSMDELLIGVLIPHVQVMRESARLFTVDTRWAIQQHDAERATRNIEAMLGISRQVSEGKFFVCTLVGYAINGMALEVLDECLHSELVFSDSQLKRIQVALGKCDATEMVDLSSERAMFMDIVQHIYTDDGNGDGRVTAVGLDLLNDVSRFNGIDKNPEEDWTIGNIAFKAIAPSSLLIMATRKQLTDKANEFFDRMEPFIAGSADDSVALSIEHDLKELPVGYAPLTMLFPALEQLRQATVRTQVNLEGAEAAVAVIRYQQKYGRYPEALEAVIGEFLDQMPHDLKNRKPLKYRLDGEGEEQSFVIYSVGMNGTDEGGAAVFVTPTGEFVSAASGEEVPKDARPLPTREYNSMNPEYPGDWILWPRQSQSE